MVYTKSDPINLNNPAILRAYDKQKKSKSNLIDVVSLEFCEYDKERKFLKLSSDHCGMPPTLIIKSHKTGREITFVQVDPTDKLYDPDGWDGEQNVYRTFPFNALPNVHYLVIMNPF